MKKLVRGAVRAMGFDVVRYPEPPQPAKLPPDASPEDRRILEAVAGYTMTSVERQLALISSIRHIVKAGIAGCYVECGVWRGGSSMAAALAFQQAGDTARELHLYDTFEGMTPPTAADRTPDGTLAQAHLDADPARTGVNWCVAGLEDVQRNMASTGYPKERVHFVRGPVEATIPSQSPAGPIALLRLDTDWYESTKHELIHLFPKLQPGGILIIDDYGHWEGAKKAVDEYFSTLKPPHYLQRVDYTGRLLVKQLTDH
jgi:O-methyltransferase